MDFSSHFQSHDGESLAQGGGPGTPSPRLNL